MANPPTPATEGVNPALQKKLECDKLKADHKVVARTHKKGAKASSSKESHHVLQDKAMTGRISKYSGFAVLLSKTEHKIANALQTKRNCVGGREGMGAKTFGQLKKDAKSDVTAALKNRKNKDTGKPISGAKLKKLAQCIVDEAVRETQKKRKKNKNKKQRKPLKNDDSVKPVKGCLAAGTQVWLGNGEQINVAQLTEGMLIQTPYGARPVQRVGQCRGQVRRLQLGGEQIDLSPQHFVQLANGSMRRADALLPGHVVRTRSGPKALTATRINDSHNVLFSVALPAHAVCYVGAIGLNVALPSYDVLVQGHVRPLAAAATISVGAVDAQHST